MPKNPSLKLNFIMNAILTASSFLFPIITFPYVSRILLPEGNGRIAFVTSSISYFSMAASLGIPTYGIRICAQVRDDKDQLSRTVQEIFIINAIMTALIYACFFAAIHMIEEFRVEKTLFLICGSTMFFNLIGIEWLYKALEQYHYITIRSILFKLISIVFMFLLVHSPEDYIIYGGITVLAGVGSNILNFINVRHYISLTACPPYRLSRHLKPIFVFFALSVATTIYTNLDVVMLQFISGSREVGYYNAAVKIKVILTSFVTSLGAVLLPRISYYVENHQSEQYQNLIRKAFDFVFLSAAPLCIFFVVMAKESILFLSGEAYLNSVMPMRVIMPTVLFIGLTNIIGIQLLVPLGEEKLVFFSTCFGALVDIVLNVYCIPRYASTGAAIGTLAAELVVLGAQVWFIRSRLKILGTGLQIHKIFASLVPAVLALFWVHRRFKGHGSFLTLTAAAASFFSIYGITLILSGYKIPLRSRT